ncbi:TonB dependent receptor [compost metagenome]
MFFAAHQDRLDPTDQADSRIDPEGTAGYAVWNARLAWVPAPALRVQVELNNLFDQRYREHGSGIDGAGFGAALMADYRFE